MSGPELLASVGVAAAIMAFAFAGVLALRTRPQVPQTGPATMDLGDEAPAIVDLLTDGFEPTPEAVPATVLDLAARRWLTIEQFGESRVLVRLRSEGRGALRPFERQVLEHLRGLAIDGVIPAEALTTGPETASARWWHRFRKAVIADARDAGLCRRRWVGPNVIVLWLAVVIALLAGWAADQTAGDSTGPRLVDLLVMTDLAAGFGLGAIATAMTKSDRQRDTPRGLAAAGRWLGVRRYLSDHADFATKPAAAVAIWDRYLAYAVALDLAPVATAQLPLGAEDDRHAWSRTTGDWRHVVVNYPRLRPGYGQHPLTATATGLLAAGVAALGVVWLAPIAAGSSGWVADLGDMGQWIRRVAAALVVVLGCATVWSALKFLAGLGDLFTTTTVEGTVLRARMRETGDWIPGPLRVLQPEPSRRSRRYFLAVDDGTGNRIRAWRVRSDRYRAVYQGAWVRAAVTPALGFVRTIKVIEAPTATAPPAADDPEFVAAVQARPQRTW